MDFMDVEGALQWGDDSNEKLHCALFSSLSKKKKKKKTTTTEDKNVFEQKPLLQQSGGYEKAVKHSKKMTGKPFEKEDLGEHDQTVFQVDSKKAKRKSLGKELGGCEQTPFQIHSKKAKGKSLENEELSGHEQSPFHIHSKKAEKKFLEKEGVGRHDTPEKRMKRKCFDTEDYNNSFKTFKQTDTVNVDGESGGNLGSPRSSFTDERQDAEHGRRKKRKRKPRNNKFEGWAKKAISQASEEVNEVEKKSLRVKGDGNVWNDMDKEDLPSERKVGGRSDETGKEDFKVNHVFKGYVKEKSEMVGQKKEKRKSGKEDKEIDEGVQDSKTEENVKGKLSENDVKYRNKTADDIRQEQEEKLAKNERNCADEQSPEEPKIIYADKKQRGKVKGKLEGTGWEQQLRSARFRFINETLYKCSGAEAFKNFKGDSAAFEVYHEGYSRQVQQWPENPVDIIIKYLKRRPQSWVVGDFGCGEAKIAQTALQKVLSFDIFRANENVTVCNISKVPLRSESLDVAVYCLSLMGSNWPDYLREGNRVLKKGGLLKIAEVASRFKSVDSFVSLLGKLGFTLKGKDLTNKMFYLFDFEKKKSCGQIPDKMASVLKPCKYKRR